MAFDGYMAFGGNEIVNNERVRGYASTADCPMTWLKGDRCVSLPDALGDGAEYTYAGIGDAPWYDLTRADLSSRFFGVFGLGATGMKTSTRSVPVTESTTDGGRIGVERKGTRSVRYRTILLARGEDALAYGASWLSSALDPGACGQHGTSCGTTDVAFLDSCPPVRPLETVYSEWEPVAVNLATNPSFERVVPGTDIVRRNLFPDPLATSGGSPWGNNTEVTQSSGDPLGSSATSRRFERIGEAYARAEMRVGVAMPLSSTVTISMRVRASEELLDVNLFIREATTSGGLQTSLGTVNIPAGESTISASGITPAANENNSGLVLTWGSGSVGSTLEISEVLFSESPGPYFDGSTPNENGFVYEWEGTPNASPSVVKAATVEVRRNLSPNPTALHLNRILSGTQPNDYSNEAGAGPTGSSALKITTSAAEGARGFGLGVALIPDADITVSGWVKAEAGNSIIVGARLYSGTAGGAIVADETESYAATGEWTRYSTTIPPTPDAQRAAFYVATSATNIEVWVSNVLIEASPVLGDYFDGTTSPDPDLTPSWVGTENASESVLSGVRVADLQGGGYVSSHRWAASGSRSLRFIADPEAASHMDILTIPNSGEGKTFTLLATIRTTDAHPGGIRLGTRTWNGTTPDEYVGGIPVGVAAPVRVTFTASPGTTSSSVRIWRGSTDADLWLDDLLIIEGEHDGPYFDGNSEGDNYNLYEWEGTENGSASTHSTRTSEDLPVSDADYQQIVDQHRRFMHDAAVTSGPIESRIYNSGEFWAQEFEFTITSERPWVYSPTRPVTLPITPTIVMQDTPYNLVPYPSAELAGDPVVVYRNLSTNPSVETNATGWIDDFDGTASLTVTSGRSLDIAAHGSASFRVRGQGTGSGGGWLHAVHSGTLPSEVQALSVSVWGALLLTAAPSGTSADELAATLSWVGSSASVPLGLVTEPNEIQGHVFVGENIPVPSGATGWRVTVTAAAEWVSGSDIRLYADAVAVVG